MSLTEPEALWTTDVHHDRNPTRSLKWPNDLVPYRPKADVVLNGHAYLPAANRQGWLNVRLSVGRGQQTLLTKTLRVFGDRYNWQATPQRFERLALRYENALGGASAPDNPVGIAAGRVPNIVAADDPHRAAGFGPVATNWPSRQRLVSSQARAGLAKPILEIGEHFDWTYFQAAPTDQRLPYLQGNEWLALDGMHPKLPRVHTQLPGVKALARRISGDGPAQDGQPIKLVADGLTIDADTQRCTLSWRGSFTVRAEAELASQWVAVGLQLGEQRISWSSAECPTAGAPAPSDQPHQAAPTSAPEPKPWERPGGPRSQQTPPTRPSAEPRAGRAEPRAGRAEPRAGAEPKPWERAGGPSSAQTAPASARPAEGALAGDTAAVAAQAVRQKSDDVPFERGAAEHPAPPASARTADDAAHGGETTTVSADMLRQASRGMPFDTTEPSEPDSQVQPPDTDEQPADAETATISAAMLRQASQGLPFGQSAPSQASPPPTTNDLADPRPARGLVKPRPADDQEQAGETTTISAAMLRQASRAMPWGRPTDDREDAPQEQPPVAKPWQRPGKPIVTPPDPLGKPKSQDRLPLPWERPGRASVPQPAAEPEREGQTGTIDPKKLAVQAPFALAATGEPSERAPKSATTPGAPWADGSGGIEREVLAPQADDDGTRPLDRASLLGLWAKKKAAPKLAAAEGLIIPTRRGDGVPLIVDPQLTAGTVPWQLKPPQPSLTVIVKASCELVPEAAATMLAEPALLCGDVYCDDDHQQSTLYDSDFAVFKAAADVTLVGQAHAPGKRTTGMSASFRFGSDDRSFERTIVVFGDRHWHPDLPIEKVQAEPFERLPIRYEYAYGGPGFAANPVGLGFCEKVADGLLRLPNLIQPPGDSQDDELLEPACFAPLPLGWRLAAEQVGTYDQNWVKSRWPFFPDDFNFRCLQAAPVAQRLPYLTGDESYEIRGMHGEHERFRGSLPGLRVRCFTQQSRAAGSEFSELEMNLDTVAVDLDQQRLFLVWRGVLDVSDDVASDLSSIYVTKEPLDGPSVSLEQARQQHQATLVQLDMVDESPLGPPEPANEATPRGEADKDETDPAQERSNERFAAKKAVATGALAAAGIGAAATEASDPSEPVAQLGDDAEPPVPTARDRVSAALTAGQPVVDSGLAGADLSDIDFREQCLAGFNLKKTNLSNCRLDGVDLQGTQLAGADLRNAVLAGAQLTRADLTDACVAAANFSEAELSSADLSGVDGNQSNFNGAKGAGARFEKADLAGAHFESAELADADFVGATLVGAVFDGALLPRIALFEARAQGASFNAAELTDARADEALLTGASFEAVSAAGSVWERSNLDDARFAGAQLSDASFNKTRCDRANFDRAVLKQARFAKASLAAATLVKANLMEASLENADLRGADLSGANLYGAEAHGAQLGDTQLTGALLAKSGFEDRL